MRQSDCRVFFVGLIFVVILTLFPFLYYQEDVAMRLNDNMDSNLAWIKMLLDNNACWVGPDTIVEQVMNGVPRSSLSSTYDFSLLVFSIFGIFWGYVFNKVLMAVMAFVGMYFLLKNHVLFDKGLSIISAITAFLYALLPFWSFGGSVALLPLVLWAFLNLRNRDERLINWLVLLFYGFYSSLILTGFFLLLAMFILFLYDLIKIKKINYPFFLSLVFLSGVYVISHWPIFYTYIFADNYVSHRKEFNIFNDKPDIFWDFLLMFRHSDKYGASHVLALQSPFIILTTGSTSFLMLFKKNICKKFVILLLLIILFSSIVGFFKVSWISEASQFINKNILPINLSRLYWFNPLLWYMIFAISLAYISKNIRFGKYIVFALFIGQLIVLYNSSEVVRYKMFPVTYKTFYSGDQFVEIKKIIHTSVDDYRVISIGMHPSIAQFNGLYTLDAYLPDYSLRYKHEFGEILKDELSEDKAMYNYYFSWGSRCYAFTAETFRSLMSSSYFDKIESPININYNFEKLKQMANGKPVYIISAVEIINPELEFVESFIRDEWYWEIRLYKVK